MKSHSVMAVALPAHATQSETGGRMCACLKSAAEARTKPMHSLKTLFFTLQIRRELQENLMHFNSCLKVPYNILFY